MAQADITPRALSSVLEGISPLLVSEQTRRAIIRLALDLDAIGRYEPDEDRALVDEHSLIGLVRELADVDLAAELVRILRGLPEPAFRGAQASGAVPREVPWFVLAEHVTIFDPNPRLSIGELDLGESAGDGALMPSVRRLVPVLELDLLSPDGLPRRLAEAEGGHELGYLLGRCLRHLAWWGALVGALLIAASRAAGGSGERGAWPLFMLIFGAAVGDYTLRIVAESLFAPVD